MKLTKQQEAEVMPIYKEWWYSYMNGDVKTYDHYLDDDYSIHLNYKKNWRKIPQRPL